MRSRDFVQTSSFESVLVNGQPLKPHYDGERRILSVAGVIVKQFKGPAKNQELIRLHGPDASARHVVVPRSRVGSVAALAAKLG